VLQLVLNELKMKRICIKIGFDFSFLIIIVNIISTRTRTVIAQKPCVFEGCACKDLEKVVYVFCTNQQRLAKGFPKRNEHFKNSTEIGFLLISFYNFTTMPEEIFANLKVNTMFISNNQLRKIEKSAFRRMHYLNYISLDEDIYDLESDAFQFIQKDLIWLSINGWSVAINDQTYFFNEIRKLTGLKRLSLQNISLTSFEKEWLNGLGNLEQLDLSWNQIESLNETAFEYAPKLKIFSIAYNKLVNLDDMLKSIKRFSNQLTDLEMSSNKIRFIEKRHLESFVKLKYLSLSDNEINNIEESSFIKNTELQRLYLDKNYLSSMPDIFKLNKLYIYNMSNQNGMLESIGNYAFDRQNGQEDLTIHLGHNKIKSIKEKAFCSRAAKTVSIKAISLDYSLVKSIDKCMLAQIGRENIGSLVLFDSDSALASASTSASDLAPTANDHSYADVCNCQLMLFLSRYNVNLEGVCASILNNLTCFNVEIRDDCANKPQYICNSAAAAAAAVVETAILSINHIIIFNFVLYYFSCDLRMLASILLN
jgi:Leucine-rich repeat (LRR) protein